MSKQPWSVRERAKLTNNWPNVEGLFPTRSEKSVASEAWRLGLVRRDAPAAGFAPRAVNSIFDYANALKEAS